MELSRAQRSNIMSNENGFTLLFNRQRPQFRSEKQTNKKKNI